MSTTLRKSSLTSLGAALLLSAAMTAPAQARGGAGDNRYERELQRRETTQTSPAQVQPQSDQSARMNGLFSDAFAANRNGDDWMFPGNNARGR